MMTIQELITEIHDKYAQLHSLRPINKEYLHKIMQKFRLEYNYHSNHLEGNSLTMSETWSFLTTQLISSGKTRKFRDYREME